MEFFHMDKEIPA